MNDEDFEKLVGEAIDSLPEEYAKRLDNVAVTFEDWPTQQQRENLHLPPWVLLFGLYEGTAQTKRGIYYSSIPDKITIFKNSILAVSRNEEELRAQVRSTVIHEIGHHFGMTEEMLAKKSKV